MNILKYLQTKTKVDDRSIMGAAVGIFISCMVTFVRLTVDSAIQVSNRERRREDPIDNRDTTAFKPYSKPIIQQIALN